MHLLTSSGGRDMQNVCRLPLVASATLLSPLVVVPLMVFTTNICAHCSLVTLTCNLCNCHRWSSLAWQHTMTSASHMRSPTKCDVSTNSSRKLRPGQRRTTTGNVSSPCQLLTYVCTDCIYSLSTTEPAYVYYMYIFYT